MEQWKEVLLALNKKQEEAIIAAATPFDVMEANENLNAYLADCIEKEENPEGTED